MKKAVGFEKTETSKEYQVDDAGNATLVRKKIQKKYFPPDLQALKAYLELEKGREVAEGLTEEELMKEKRRLLEELKREQEDAR